MNCKPGDLAVFVKSKAGNEGRIVTVLRLAASDEVRRHHWVSRMGPVWLIDSPVPSRLGLMVPLACDEILRPIRDNDGEDETLQWAGKPKEDLLKVCDRLIQEFNKIADMAKEIQK